MEHAHTGFQKHLPVPRTKYKMFWERMRYKKGTQPFSHFYETRNVVLVIILD